MKKFLLEKIKIKTQKTIADLGCRTARVAEYFKDNKLFYYITLSDVKQYY